MKCPNCRCEIGNQPTCPYCGRVIYQTIRRASEDNGTSQFRVLQSALNRLHRSLTAIELRSRLAVILLTGIFVLQILLVLISIIK